MIDGEYLYQLSPYLRMAERLNRKYGSPKSLHPNDDSGRKEHKVCAYSKCDITHTHNNACCSAKHYKLWRKEND